MLKRLITVVFVMALFTAFASTAFSDTPRDNLVKQERPGIRVQNDIQRPAEVQDVMYSSPTGINRSGDLSPATFSGGLPQPSGPDHLCETVNYLDFGGPFYITTWTGDDPSFMGSRFSVTEFNHFAEINGANIGVQDVVDASGTAQVVLKVFENDGGIPGAELYSEAYDFSTVTDPDGAFITFHFFPLTTPVQVPPANAEYFIAVGTGATGTASDEIVFGLNQNADGTDNGRGVFSPDPSAAPATWVTLTTAFGGFPLNLVVASDVCNIFSECYTTGTGLTNIIPCPLPGYTDGDWNGWGQRFSAVNDTLKTVNVYFYVPSSTQPQVYAGTNETNGAIIEIWADDGAGAPDLGLGPLATRSIAGGLANMFPSCTGEDRTACGTFRETHVFDFSPENLVFRGAWHVTVRMTSNDPADGQVWVLVEDFGEGGSVNYSATPWELAGSNFSWLNEIWGNDVAFNFDAVLCKDEFQECQTQILWDNEWTWSWDMSDPVLSEVAQRINGTDANRVEAMRFQVFTDGPSAQIEVFVRADTGAPGGILYSDIVTPTAFPGWTEVVIPGGVVVLGDFFIGYRPIFNDPVNDVVVALTEADDNPNVPHPNPHAVRNGGVWWYDATVPEWWNFLDALSWVDNLMAEADFCSVPVAEKICQPGSDWSTVQYDFGRTGHSDDAIGDAWCDLTLNWTYTDPDFGIIFAGPIIWNDYVVQAYSSAVAGKYVILDLLTGAVLDEINSTDYPFTIGGNIRCIPTITEVDSAGLVRPMLIIAGGTAASVSAWDMTTVGGPIVRSWTIDQSNNWNGLGNLTGEGFVQSVRYGNFIVLNDGVEDVLYFTDDFNYVYAVEAATGLPYAGWAGAGGFFALDGNPLRSGSTDGSQLFYTTFTSGIEGTVYALDAFSGTENWNLRDDWGLQAATLDSNYAAGSETFAAGAAYFDGELYANSNATAAFPDEGVFYRMDAATGEILSATKSQDCQLTYPLVDQTAVYMLTLYSWSSSGASGQYQGSVLAFDRRTGAFLWSSTTGNSRRVNWSDTYIGEGVLTCEPEERDIIVAFNSSFEQFSFSQGDFGYMSFFAANDGEELFHRRIDYGAGNNHGRSGAMGADSNGDVHVIWATVAGGLFDLTKQADRPRLEILKWTDNLPVPFGTGPDTIVEFPDVYTNTGCTDLIVTLTASDASNGVTVGMDDVTVMRERFNEASAGLANSLTADHHAWKFAQTFDRSTFAQKLEEVPNIDLSRGVTNDAAMAVPPFLIQQMGSYTGDVFDDGAGSGTGANLVTAPGDLSSIFVRINGELVNRGPNSFYVEFDHNDPDYFLNDNTKLPQIFLTLIGGCLSEGTDLHFGDGEANLQTVYNTGRIVEGNGVAQFDVGLEGGGSSQFNIFQGTYMMGVADPTNPFDDAQGDSVSSRRIALNSVDWVGGAGRENSWLSMQGDPNFCNDDCTPALNLGVSMAMVTTDGGATYAPLLGNMVCKTYIDSVQNFELGGTWDWSYGGSPGNAPFDNDLTMGLRTNTRTFGVIDPTSVNLPLLNFATLELYDFWETNGDTVPTWHFGAFIDHDINLINNSNFDTTFIDQSVSAVWSAAPFAGDGPNLTQVGFVKIPFGCGYDPVINAVPVLRNATASSGGNEWDLVYDWMTGADPGFEITTAAGNDDEDGFYTLLQHDFGPNDTIQFATAMFHVEADTDPTIADETIAPLAHLYNKLAGFGRGDIDNDNAITLGDLVGLIDHIGYGGPGAVPFMHLSDVNADGATDVGDVTYMIDYYFNYGPCPMGEFVF